MMEIKSTSIKKAVVAGRFYPDSCTTLKEEIDSYIAQAAIQAFGGNMIGFVSPHAGYIYSGAIAGYAYKQIIDKDFDTIFILAPSHYVPIHGISVLDMDYYETPLGRVKINRDITSRLLAKGDWVKYNPGLFAEEHSLEVQIPFIQRTQKKDLAIVPIIMGSNSIELAEKLSDTLYNFKEKNAFYIASSDMSHFLPYDQAVKKDKQTLSLLRQMDIINLARETDNMCGIGPVLTLMKLTKKMSNNSEVKVLYYANSGDTAGSKDSVVGYSSVAFIINDYLTAEEKSELLNIARKSIEDRLNNRSKTINTSHKSLKKNGAAFVTLKVKKKLRGCIGHIAPVIPLYKCIQEMAVSAATRDPRFHPLSLSEMDNLDIDISVLTPLKKIKDIDDIIVGRDGLLIKKGGLQGVLLPQVATEHGLTRESFLEHTSLKAGLSSTDWKEKETEIYTFQAIVFSEG